MTVVRTLRRAARRVLGRGRPDGRARRSKEQRDEGLLLPDPWMRLMRWLGVDLFLDVGGNRGQSGLGLRTAGYQGRIVSFEPLSAARERLERRARGDDRWDVSGFALGEREEEAILNVAGNLGSSSLLPMAERHRIAAPRSAYVGTELVQVRRLDSLADELLEGATRPWLKLDVQGSELAILRGAGDRLPSFCAVQLELSLVPLYEGGPLHDEVEAMLRDAGFVLAGVTQGFSDPDTGRMLQMDALWVRAALLD